DLIVTGVQTCALPISISADADEVGTVAIVFAPLNAPPPVPAAKLRTPFELSTTISALPSRLKSAATILVGVPPVEYVERRRNWRSEERRVGKECRVGG